MHIFKGRGGNDVDINIKNISVSRNHASLTINSNNQIILKDHKSKFGTLVKLNNYKLAKVN